MANLLTRFWQTLTIRKLYRLFSQLNWTTFDQLPLEKRLVDRLKKLNITTLTEIQRKALGAVLTGNNVIINSETGSGKTLCYLIPILNGLLRPLPRQHGPSALVLVPTMDLGFQISELFNKLCDPGFFACSVHRDTQLHINKKYPIIVSTPHTLLQYNIKSLSTVQTVVIDEADLIIASGGKSVWKILNSFRDNHQLKGYKNSAVNLTQFVFVAATLPRRGEKSVWRKIKKWLPDLVHVTTSMVHQFVPTVRSVDVFMEEEEKLPQLLRYLNILSGQLVVCEDSYSKTMDREDKLNFVTVRRDRTRVLVFVNTVYMAKTVFEFLSCEEGRRFEVFDRKSASNRKDESSVVCQHRFCGDHVDSWAYGKTKAFSMKTGSTLPWRGKIGLLHKEVPLSERQKVLENFKTNDIVVLVCTDIGSRGLDILDISHVIQFDCAHNAADVLHRAGRTARAGAQGTVINFITQKDEDLMKAIQLSKKGPGAEGFQEIFSRNRMFSRRIKKKL